MLVSASDKQVVDVLGNNITRLPAAALRNSRLTHPQEPICAGLDTAKSLRKDWRRRR